MNCTKNCGGQRSRQTARLVTKFTEISEKYIDHSKLTINIRHTTVVPAIIGKHHNFGLSSDQSTGLRMFIWGYFNFHLKLSLLLSHIL